MHNHIQRLKKTCELIAKCQNITYVQYFMVAPTIENVRNVAEVLLEQQIFESTLKTKVGISKVSEASY